MPNKKKKKINNQLIIEKRESSLRLAMHGALGFLTTVHLLLVPKAKKKKRGKGNKEYNDTSKYRFESGMKKRGKGNKE